MKLKNCKVDLVANTIKEIGNLIERIDEVFENVTNSTVRKIDWAANKNIDVDVDYRTSVYFSYFGTKEEIYKIMNQIKSNPITFLK